MGSFKLIKYLVLIPTVTCIPLSAIAQKQVVHQNLLWTRYALKLNINNHWSASQEFEERTYWFPWRQHQFVSRSLAQYQFENGWNFGGGFAYFLQAVPQDPHIKEYDNELELRPQLELAYKERFSEKFTVSHRYWSEFRYFKPQNDNIRYGNIRMRYKLEIQYRPITNVTFKIYDEVFVNIGKNIGYNVFDQNRIGASIQYMPVHNVGFELGYLNWFQQRASGNNFYNRNIIRLSIHHNINFKSKAP